MKPKYYIPLICLLLIIALDALYRSKVAAVAEVPEFVEGVEAPPPSMNTIIGSEDATATMGETAPEEAGEPAEATDTFQKPLSEYTREDWDDYYRRREEECNALGPPLDQRRVAWTGYRFYEAPQHVRDDYYQYLLEKYAGWDSERASEERQRIRSKYPFGDTRLPREESERFMELGDYRYALIWQFWREKYAGWDYARAKEELDRLTDTENERPLTDEERQRRWELFGFDMGIFRHEYLLEKYAGWDIARAEEELDRLKTMQLSTEERLSRRYDLLQYIGILRREAQDSP